MTGREQGRPERVQTAEELIAVDPSRMTMGMTQVLLLMEERDRLRAALEARSDERGALRLAIEWLGACHVVEEGPNAGWTDDGEYAEYDEDFVCRADCGVCRAEAACRKALGI